MGGPPAPPQPLCSGAIIGMGGPPAPPQPLCSGAIIGILELPGCCLPSIAQYA